MITSSSVKLIIETTNSSTSGSSFTGVFAVGLLFVVLIFDVSLLLGIIQLREVFWLVLTVVKC